MFQTNLFKIQEAHSILCLIFSKTLPIWYTVKYTQKEASQKWKYNTVQDIACSLTKSTDAHKEYLTEFFNNNNSKANKRQRY
jgi:hypothetical protein